MSKREQKIFQIIGQVVVCGTIYLSFIGMFVYGVIHCTILN